MNSTDIPVRVSSALSDAGACRILIPEHDADVLVMSQGGATVLDLCDGTRSITQIAAVLAERTGVAADLIERDTLAFLSQLESSGAVQSRSRCVPDITEVSE